MITWTHTADTLWTGTRGDCLYIIISLGGFTVSQGHFSDTAMKATKILGNSMKAPLESLELAMRMAEAEDTKEQAR